MSRLRHYPLRIHQGWTLETNYFMDCDPETVPPDNVLDGSAYSRKKFCYSSIMKYALDLGWWPEADPKGEFILDLVTYRLFEPLLTIETRNLHEVADAIDKITWGVSQGILPFFNRSHVFLGPNHSTLSIATAQNIPCLED